MIDHTGTQIHTVVQEDPLELRAVKLDIGVWAHPMDDDPPPGVNSGVLVIYVPEEDKWFWVGVVYSVELIGYNGGVDLEALYEQVVEEEEDDADWWKHT